MDDLRDLLDLLNRHNVEFLVIGAHALAHHGHPRATKDVDVWARRDLENARRLADALQEFGATIGDQGANTFATQDRQMIRLGVAPDMVDILNFAGDAEFESVWEGREEGTLFDVKVNYPSRVALIEMKRTAGRLQDLADIAKLEGR